MTRTNPHVKTLNALAQAEPKRDRYGRYLIPPVDGGKPIAHTRATTVAETLDDRYNLELWKMRQVAVGLTRRPDLQAKIAADEHNKKAVNDACQEAMDAAESGAAANTGIALHRILERVDTGELTAGQVPDMFRDIANAYTAALTEHHVTVDPTWCERVHVLAGMLEPIAGMADNHITIDGRRYISDKKTGSGIDFGAKGFAVQLAIYARAQTVFDYSTNQHCDMPEIDQDRAVIMHIPAAGGPVQFHWIDIAAGWEALDHALWTRHWRKQKHLLTPFNIEAETESPTPPESSNPTRIEPVGFVRLNLTQAPEGGPVPADKIEALRTRAQTNLVVNNTVGRWVKEGTQAKVAWNLGTNPELWTERRYALSTAALAVAEHLAADVDVDTADEIARIALTSILGVETPQPPVAVGAVIGTLTVDQARQLWKIAKTARLLYIDNGSPQLTVTA